MVMPFPFRLTFVAAIGVRLTGHDTAAIHRRAVLDRDMTDGQQPHTQDERGEALTGRLHGALIATPSSTAQP